MKKYILVRAHGTHADRDLAQGINARLAEGWELYGSPFSDSSEECTVLCQAMIKVGSFEE